MKGMFPYVGSPVFYAGPRRKRRWRFFSSVPGVSIEGMVEVLPDVSDTSDEAIVSVEAISSVVSCATSRVRNRKRRFSLPCRKFSSRRGVIQPFTRAQKALCDWPNDSALQCLLSKSDKWNFDPFLLNRLSGGHPVWYLGWKLFEIYDFAQIFHLEWTSIFYCLRLIEHGYFNNRFHNCVHAADVAQALHCFLNETVVHSALSPLEKLGSILAAFGHDLYHRGLNQKFLENSNHFLCSLYNKVSVLENFHWRCLVSILIESRLAFEFSGNQWRELLKILELLILATDMQRQQEYLNQFQVFLRCNDPSTIGFGSSSNIRLMQILIKCADIGNPCRPWKLSQEWSYRASTEFFSQGDEERRLNMPLTSFCDRYATSVPKIQSGFMEIVAQPLFADWNRYIQSSFSETLMKNLKDNCDHWTELLHSEILAGVVSGRRDSAVSSSTIRSSLEEMADMEMQKPEILQRRRVSASVLLTTPLRHSGNSTPVRTGRRISLPATMHSSTVWTVQRAGKSKGIIETRSMENIQNRDGPITFETPVEVKYTEQRSVVHQMVTKLDDLPEIGSSTPSITSPKQENQNLQSPSGPSGRLELEEFGGWSRYHRRHSAPIIAEVISVDNLRAHKKRKEGRLDQCQQSLGRSMPRRGSLPLTRTQLELLRLTETRSIGSCTTSERIHVVEAS